MAERQFVARDAEMDRLRGLLARALEGETQVCFVVGDAGSGKSTLVQEFADRAEGADPDLVVAVGTCNAQTGGGDPYLPWREVLAQLTGDIDAKVAQKQISTQNATRLKELLRVSGATLLEFGPDLIGTLVPGASLVGRIATYAAEQVGMTDKLKKEVAETAQAASSVPTELDQTKIFQQYTNVLAALTKDRPLVIVLDDLQWADAPSINLLFHLVRQLTAARLLIVGAYRPDDVALGRGVERHPLEQVINEIKRYKGDVEIDLVEAREKAGRAFVDALLDREPNVLGSDFRDALYERTGGHPLFTVEMLAYMQERGDLVHDEQGRLVEARAVDWEMLPARIEGVIEERIGRLDDDTSDMLRTASVEGVIFTTQIIARLQDMQERQLLKTLSRELEKRHQLVEEAGEVKLARQVLTRYRFTNKVIQQYLYNDLSGGERRLLHGEIAEALEELYAGHTDQIAVQLGLHYEQAGDTEKAAEYLTQAGEQAFRISAYKEACAFFTRALTLAEEDGNKPWQMSLTRQIGFTQLGLSEFAEAKRFMERSLALAREAGNRSGMAAALNGLGRVATEMGAYPEAKERLEESLGIGREIGDKGGLVPILKNLGIVHVWLGEYDEAKGHVLESLQLAQEVGDKPGMASAYNHLAHMSMDQGLFDEAKGYLEKSLPLAQEIGDKGSVAVALLNLGMVAARQGNLQEANAREQEALVTARQVGNKWVIAGILSQLGLVAGALGGEERGKAEGYLHEGLHTAMEIGAVPVALFALFGVASMRVYQGQPREAVELLGLILENPANISATREMAEQLLEQLKAKLPPDLVRQALERGKTLRLEEVAEGIAHNMASV